jgi:hypothetical protein
LCTEILVWIRIRAAENIDSWAGRFGTRIFYRGRGERGSEMRGRKVVGEIVRVGVPHLRRSRVLPNAYALD